MPVSNPAGDGDVPVGWHSRKRLPHYDGGEIPQSLIFRLAGSVPKAVMDQLDIETRHLPEGVARSLRGTRIDAWLDKGEGNTWLADTRIARLVEGSLLYFDGDRYRLHSWVVMPNHVHCLLTPCHGHTLSGILHSLKSYTAQKANRILGRKGAFWEQEYHDRFIRDDQHYNRVVNYIEENPVKAGLCRSRTEWRYSSAWKGREPR